jgi:hypothetical protein
MATRTAQLALLIDQLAGKTASARRKRLRMKWNWKNPDGDFQQQMNQAATSQ